MTFFRAVPRLAAARIFFGHVILWSLSRKWREGCVRVWHDDRIHFYRFMIYRCFNYGLMNDRRCCDWTGGKCRGAVHTNATSEVWEMDCPSLHLWRLRNGIYKIGLINALNCGLLFNEFRTESNMTHHFNWSKNYSNHDYCAADTQINEIRLDLAKIGSHA